MNRISPFEAIASSIVSRIPRNKRGPSKDLLKIIKHAADKHIKEIQKHNRTR